MSTESRIISRSFLASLGIHLFLMCAVTVVIGPRMFPRPERLEIAFFGAIAEEPLLFSRMESVPMPVFRSGIKKRAVWDRTRPSWQTVSLKSPALAFPQVERHDQILVRARRKHVFATLSHGSLESRMETGIQKGAPFFAVEGPAGKRTLEYAPKIEGLVLPWDLIRSHDIEVAVKFWLSEAGWVTKTVPVLSSGYIEVELAVSRYLRRCRFAVAQGRYAEETRWGVARFPLSRMAALE